MYRHFPRFALVGAALLAAAACQDSTSPTTSSLSPSALTAALSSVPIGYGDLSTSYVGVTGDGAPTAGLWIAGGREASFDRGEMMGGGLHEAFAGALGFPSRGGNRGPFGGGLNCAATFDAASGRLVCADEVHHGLTLSRSAQYLSASGSVQQAFDTLATNSVNMQTKVTGTLTFDRAADSATADDHGREHYGRGRGGAGRLLGDTATILTATTTIASSSDRTVTGLAQGSTQRTVSGTSAGQESTTGTSTRGSFTATRTVGDTTTGLVIPVVTGSTSYPSAGTVVRSILATLKYANENAVSLARREVVTYDGTATAKITITENGATKSCTRTLPRGPLVCP